MTIREVSKKYDIAVDTLRYYERIGLIPPVNKNASGVRVYTEEDCNWVNFAKCMRSVGLSIEVLAEYIALFQQGNSTIGARKDLLIEQRKMLIEKIKEKQQALEQLNKNIERYEERILVKEEELKKSKH
ncbi:MerR family transcriptional regulator [Clostridium sp.]|uniref:MerR family transcriptional regulator n=1 Tax=Clostridium sp. TaxID=1506 RepID=UPI002614D938|nr:MerR family transcriptional regulator [Clostridium sp.]